MSEIPSGGGLSERDALPAQQRRRQIEAVNAAAMLRRRPIVPTGSQAIGPTATSATFHVLYREDLQSLTEVAPGGTEVIPVWDSSTNKIRWFLP